MVAKPETLNHFIFNSDYPTDKIVWLKEGQDTTPSSITTKTVFIDVPSELGNTTPIFVKGAYTLDNWATAYMVGSDRVSSASPDMYIKVTVAWNTYSPGTGLKLNFIINNNAGRNKTVKYRLWGLQREDVSMAINYNKNSNLTKSKLIFNSENNYPRLYKDGIASGGDTIKHELKRIPYMDIWQVFMTNGVIDQWWYLPIGVLAGDPASITSMGVGSFIPIQATDSEVIFSGSSTNKYYYRIYA